MARSEDELSELPDTPLYNTKAVSLRTGVPADTFRAWERRYGVPKPRRGPDDHRLYSERDIAAIGWLRRRTVEGLTIRRAVALLYPRNGHAPRAGDAAFETPDDAARLLVGAFSGLDSPRVERILDAALGTFGVEAMCIGVIQPAMYRIGQEWAEGRLPISVEHFATYLVRGRLARLIEEHAPAPGALGPVITACAPGERHELGLLMLHLFLLRRGVEVLHLGADLPLEELGEIARWTRPRVICLSATTDGNARALVDAVKALVPDQRQRRLPRVACGGWAFAAHPALRAEIEDLWLGADAREAADALVRVLRDADAPPPGLDGVLADTVGVGA